MDRDKVWKGAGPHIASWGARGRSLLGISALCAEMSYARRSRSVNSVQTRVLLSIDKQLSAQRRRRAGRYSGGAEEECRASTRFVSTDGGGQHPSGIPPRGEGLGCFESRRFAFTSSPAGE